MMIYTPDIGRTLTFSTAVRTRLSKDFIKTLEDLNIDYKVRRRSLVAG